MFFGVLIVYHYVGYDIPPDLSRLCLDQSKIEEMTRIHDTFISFSLFISFHFFFYVYIAYIVKSEP